jgi:hypothetical protein
MCGCGCVRMGGCGCGQEGWAWGGVFNGGWGGGHRKKKVSTIARPEIYLQGDQRTLLLHTALSDRPTGETRARIYQIVPPVQCTLMDPPMGQQPILNPPHTHTFTHILKMFTTNTYTSNRPHFPPLQL